MRRPPPAADGICGRHNTLFRGLKHLAALRIVLPDTVLISERLMNRKSNACNKSMSVIRLFIKDVGWRELVIECRCGKVACAATPAHRAAPRPGRVPRRRIDTASPSLVREPEPANSRDSEFVPSPPALCSY